MGIRYRVYVWSLLASVVLMALVGAIASVPGCSAMWVLLLPGALLAAIVFPQGPESDYGLVFLLLAGLLDVVLFAFPLAWLWKLFERHRRAKA